MKISKKILSIILCFAMLIALSLPSFAAAEKTAFIVVSGMNTFPLYEDGDKKVFPMSGDVTAKMIFELLPPALSFLVTSDYETFTNGVIPAAKNAFVKLACDDNGNSICNVNTQTFPGTLVNDTDYFIESERDEFAVVRAGMEKFGVENTFFFNYDWRMNPLDHADKLNTFIKNVKAQTGCDRIALAAFSMGGTVVCSYLYKYGSADLDSISLCSTAFQGTTCVGSLFTGDLKLDMFALMRRLAQLTRKNATENLVLYLGSLLGKVGVNAALEKFVTSITDNTKNELYKDLVIPVFAHMLGLWALVDDVNYENAKAFMLDETENAVIIKKADEYHYNVQQKAAELLKKAQNDTNVYILAQYNMQGLPVSDIASNTNNDYLIDTTYASGGAICSDLDKTLGEGYIQKINDGHNHLSFDSQIDASTCMLPEYTWFIRDMGHVDYPYGESTDFILWLAESEKYVTIFDNAKYPQFMSYSYATNTLVPVDKTINDKTTSDKAYDIAIFATDIVLKLCDFTVELVKGILA